MPDRSRDDELLAAALGRGSDCPAFEQLEHLIGEAAPPPLKQHLDRCQYCQTELPMLRSFTSSEVAPHEKAAVDSIAARLKTRVPEIAPRRVVEERQPWWRPIVAVSLLTRAAAAFAVVLMAAGVAIQFKQGRRPPLETATGEGEVLRSYAIAISSPVGDVREKPAAIRWETTPNAARYRVQILQVDRAELWSAENTAPRIDLPPAAENLIVPMKALLIQVAAFDAAGVKIAESETARFRLLQKLYTH
jgi:hypothetical protein